MTPSPSHNYGAFVACGPVPLYRGFLLSGLSLRFPPSSPLKPYPKKPLHQRDVIKFPEWNDPPPGTSQENIPVRPIVMNSEMWFKRHSIAIGEVPACRLVHRRQLTEANVEEIWKSMTLSYLQKVLGLDSLEEVLDTKLVNSKFIIHNVYSVSKQGVVILDDKSRPNCSDWKQPMYLGFEKDVFKTIADYYGHLKEPLLTFHLFDAFVSVLGLLQKEKMAIEAFQICCLLLPPENRRKLQLLMRMMARICSNKEMPPLCDGFGTRTLMVQTFSRCILCSKDEVDLDELLAARLVTFLMDNYQEILKVPLALQTSIEERVAHLRRVQFQKSYPEVYQERFPTPESEALLFPEKPKPKPQLFMWALRKPFQPFQRTRSFRM
ncbi:hypothetical protein ACRRTK_020137 [Alexandromys fortis]